jgi:myo-inositol-1(or 4)-monophosphatase
MTPPDLDGLLAAATDAAHQAGRRLLQRFRNGIRGEVKGNLDVVTEADRDSERFLRERLLGLFPGDRFLGEEDGESAGRDDAAGSRLWSVDPLDGTVNFLHGHPFFCISIALLERGEPLVGVVEAPALGWTYAAARGRGATRNGEPLRVSAIATLDQALIGTGWPPASHARPGPFLARLDAVLRRTHGARRCGSAALDLALTADGTYDAYYEMALHSWDVAAGILLVREAGGRVTDYDGAPADASGRAVLASNGVIHDAVLELIRGSEIVLAD